AGSLAGRNQWPRPRRRRRRTPGPAAAARPAARFQPRRSAAGRAVRWGCSCRLLHVAAFEELGEVLGLHQPLKPGGEWAAVAAGLLPRQERAGFGNAGEKLPPPVQVLPPRVFVPSGAQMRSTRRRPVANPRIGRQQLVVEIDDVAMWAVRDCTGLGLCSFVPITRTGGVCVVSRAGDNKPVSVCILLYRNTSILGVPPFVFFWGAACCA